MLKAAKAGVCVMAHSRGVGRFHGPKLVVSGATIEACHILLCTQHHVFCA
jgi:hypothetical protein